VAASCERSPPPVGASLEHGCRAWARHRGVAPCAPRSRASEPARSGARARLALTHPCATNAVACAPVLGGALPSSPRSPADERSRGALRGADSGAGTWVVLRWGPQAMPGVGGGRLPSSVVAVSATKVGRRGRIGGSGLRRSPLVVLTVTRGRRDARLPDGGQACTAGVGGCGDGPVRRRRAAVDQLDAMSMTEEAVERDRPGHRMAHRL
jgi:hypothetical protein